MPDVVDADENPDDRGLLREHVALEPALQVGHLVAADAGVDDLDAQLRLALGDRLVDQPAVAAFTGPALRDRVAEEGDLLARLERQVLGGPAVQAGHRRLGSRRSAGRAQEPHAQCQENDPSLRHVHRRSPVQEVLSCSPIWKTIVLSSRLFCLLGGLPARR